MNQTEEQRQIREALREAARKYGRLGYRVLEQPDESSLPHFLRGQRPDLVAFGKKKNVVIEVKTADARIGKELTKLTRTLERQPDWRLELVVLEGDCTGMPSEPNAAETDDGGPRAKLNSLALRRRMAAAQKLVRTDHAQEGVLLLWTVAEGALRLLALRNHVELDRETPRAIAKQMTMLGYVEKGDYRILEQAATIRNAVVHGRTLPTTDQRFVERLSDLTLQLLAEVARTPKLAKRKSQEVYKPSRPRR
jgi:hypothetical protein